jgi:hypothetical protein
LHRYTTADERRQRKIDAGEPVYAVPLIDDKDDTGEKSKWGPQDKPEYEVDPSTT